MSIIEWLNEPNGDGVPKYSHFRIGADVGIELVEFIGEVVSNEFFL